MTIILGDVTLCNKILPFQELGPKNVKVAMLQERFGWKTMQGECLCVSNNFPVLYQRVQNFRLSPEFDLSSRSNCAQWWADLVQVIWFGVSRPFACPAHFVVPKAHEVPRRSWARLSNSDSALCGPNSSLTVALSNSPHPFILLMHIYSKRPKVSQRKHWPMAVQSIH